MAQCITCGTELHPERAQKYNYCMAPACREKNAKGLTMVAIGMNKAADELVILDERTREALANGKYQDQRRGSFGPPAPSPATASPTTAAATSSTTAAKPGTASRAAPDTAAAATSGTTAANAGSNVRHHAATYSGDRADRCRGHAVPSRGHVRHRCSRAVLYRGRVCTSSGCRGRPGPGSRASWATAPTAGVPPRAGQHRPAEVERLTGAARAALQPAGAAAGRDRGQARRQYLPRDPDRPRGQEPPESLTAPADRATVPCRVRGTCGVSGALRGAR